MMWTNATFSLKGAAPDAPSGPLQPQSSDTAEQQDQTRIPEVLPILPVRNVVLFPATVIPLTIDRADSVRLLEESLPQSKIIGVITQRQPETDKPRESDLSRVGTVCVVLKLLRHPTEAVILVMNCIQRFAIRRVVQSEPYLRAEIEPLNSTPLPAGDKEAEAALRSLRQMTIELLEASPGTPEELRMAVLNIEDPGYLTDFIATNLSLDIPQKQQLLEELNVTNRVRTLQNLVSTQLEIARIQLKLQQDVSSQFTDMQRRVYLREQIRAIQRELGEGGEGNEEQVERLRKRIAEAQPPRQVIEQVERELKRLVYIPAASPEFAVIVSYVDIVSDLPWNKFTEDNLDLNRAQSILDRDHFDLEKVKRRLIEYLAVRKLNPQGRGPILCFLGPPGVGKTSLGQSIADALGSKFARMSLGGMRDEAEIRGHRRTYIGSMPGRVIQELRRLGTRNPVMMLDEIDKLGADFRGDPASALLEVLDPRQNHAFVDHYLDVPFDLSQVIFIATANYMDPVPPALRDRVEAIEIPGYTDREKLEIARNYLLGRQIAENGLRPEQCEWTSAALVSVIDDYTREAGVRELERQIGAVCRAVAATVARGEHQHVLVTPAQVQETLGSAKYIRETALKTNQPGVVTGLAYTPFGGEVLHIEAARFPGKGDITLTGQIGAVMKESAQAAWSLVRSRAKQLGISPRTFRQNDVHIHVPSGAVPKDGPSAGIAMFTALASLFTGNIVSGAVAMTGEISLRGLVLPIGGLKEKTLAAMRAGIERAIIPRLNEKDLPDVPEEVKQKLQFTLADNVDEVLAAALLKKRQGSRKNVSRQKGGFLSNRKDSPRRRRAQPRNPSFHAAL